MTRLLSRTHAQGINYSVCLCHGPHDMYRDLGIITAIKYSKETDLASFGFDRYWLYTGAKMLVGHTYQPRAFCPCARSTNLMLSS